MIMKNKLLSFLILIMVLPVLFSCNFLENEKSYVADTYIIVSISGEDTIYALEAYAQSNYSMSSVTLTSEADSNFECELEPAGYYGTYYQKSAVPEDFSTVKPAESVYRFSIVFSDETSDVVEDHITSSIILPPVISEVISDKLTNSISITWQQTDNADIYTIKMFRNDTLVYLSNLIDESISSKEITFDSNGWYSYSNINPGDSLDIIVVGILKETGNSETIRLQSLSLSDTVTTVWPE